MPAVPESQRFSVLLPVYIGDCPEHFVRALTSVTEEQVLRPSQVVIVADGPVVAEIDGILSAAETGCANEQWGGVPLEVVRIPVNGGLTDALNRGLQRCSNDIVARADADDISLPERFATQVPLFDEGYDLVGSAISEFDINESIRGMVRRMPVTIEQIRRALPLRDPFNHPTVVYRASRVREVGGYEHVDHMEDYWLFARMVHRGMRCLNVEQTLVLYRVGAGAYERRGGRQMLCSEVALQRKLWGAGIVTGTQFCRNIVVRGVYRLIPSTLRRLAYRFVGRLSWFRPSPGPRSAR